MIISSVVIGMIIMTMAGSISQITSQQFEPNPTKYEINMIKDKAKKLDLEYRRDRERLERTLDVADSYNSEISYWEEQECVNITLTRIDERYEMNCVEGGLTRQSLSQKIIESFEEGIDHYAGDTEDFSTTQNSFYDGEHSLTTESTDASYIFTDEFNNLPGRGDTFHAYFKTDSIYPEGYGEMYFASQDGDRDNSYFIRISHRDGWIRLYKRGNGNGNEQLLDQDNFEIYELHGQWNLVEVDFGDTSGNTIEVSYYLGDDRTDQRASLSATDIEFDGGQIGWSMYDDSGGTTDIYWDYMRYSEDEN